MPDNLKKLVSKGHEAYDRKDYAEAVKWYRKAAEQGDTGAQEALKRPWGAVTRTPSFLRRGIQTKGFNPLRLNPAFAGMTREAKG